VKTKTAVIVADLVFHHDAEPIVDFRKAWARPVLRTGSAVSVAVAAAMQTANTAPSISNL
jgi:hypothetical protein